MEFRISYILLGGQFGIEPGYVVFGLAPPGTLPRITVDLNVRVRKHETYSGFEDVTGADPASLRQGDRILAVEVEDQICADAIVTGVDVERRLVYLVPDWQSWRDDLADESVTDP